MADTKEDEDLSSSIATTGGSAWTNYVKVFLPAERAADFTKEESIFEVTVIKVVGEEVWKALPMEIRVNVIRGNAHEKERLKVTSESAKKIYEWRLKHNVDKEALTAGPLPGSEVYYACWPSRVAGLDVYGHPILYDRYSTMDFQKLCAMDEGDVYHFRTQALESLMYLKAEVSAKLGLRVCKHVYVLDLAGLESSFFSSTIQKKMRAVMKMSADMFPETLWTVWLVNAPTSFRLIWSVIRNWLDPMIRSKVRMWGSTKSKWHAAMAECGIPVSSLPQEFGGTSPSEGLQDILVRAAKANADKAN